LSDDAEDVECKEQEKDVKQLEFKAVLQRECRKRKKNDTENVGNGSSDYQHLAVMACYLASVFQNGQDNPDRRGYHYQREIPQAGDVDELRQGQRTNV
jgi:hypothetical protein